MKVYELMALLKDCPAGDDVQVGGYMDKAEIKKAEDKSLCEETMFNCRKMAQDVFSGTGVVNICF